jgi:hypothetical protein
VWDLGTLRFSRGGTLRVALVSDRAEQATPAMLSIYDVGGAFVENLAVADREAHSTLLAPGSYVLQTAGAGVASTSTPFDIRSDAETKLELPLVEGIAVVVDIEVPPGESTSRGVNCIVTDAAGNVVLRTLEWSPQGPPRMQTTLRAGSYTVTATTAASHGAASFEVAAPGPVQAHVVMKRN